MKTVTLHNHCQRNSTLIDNEFIDKYMIKANGEYVKVYLLLLRHLNDPSTSLSISQMADCLENTEKDILRALKHWVATGLLTIEYDESGNISALGIGNSAPIIPAKPVLTVVPEQIPTVKQLKSRKELKQLLFVAEQYLGKTLSKTDVETITSFYDDLQFSAELIEYLIEYCVEKGHKSMHYIQTVALAWSDEHITTVTDAKVNSSEHNKSCYAIMKAFGITGRGPATTELDFMNKWNDEYGLTLDIIIESCNRTIQSIHQPSFEYADSILKNWIAHNVHHITDINQLDLDYKKERELKKKTVPKIPSKNKFNNFEGRTYDMDALEQQLLNTK
ncbi:MAG: DnaD domain protein [Lachnospiraceae bacterium]